MNKLLIIGLDGASPELIQRWKPDLPHLSKLIERGSSGTLFSTIPPRSVPAWYSFVTGANPAKLGVFGFSQRLPDKYDYTFANFTYCQAPPFWHWLEGTGVKTAVIHVPGTYPPRPLDGFLVSGWPAPTNMGNLTYTHPQELSREIDSFLGQPFEFSSPIAIEHENDHQMLAERLRILEMHGDVAAHLLQDRDWQVAMVVFSPLDRASHQFWRHMDAQHPAHDPQQSELLQNALKDVYVASDRQLGRLLTNIGENDWVIVVSDHGFGPTHRTFYLNEWLQQKGYLVLKEQDTGRVTLRSQVVAALAKPAFVLNDISPLFRRLVAPLKKRALSNFVRTEYVRVKERGLVRLNHLPVDWSRTVAYCPDESTLYLNLRGRDPQGIVEPGAEAERILNEIEQGLRQLKAPGEERELEVQVWRKEEIYSGPYLEEAPEMIIALDDFRTNVMAEMGAGALFDSNPRWSANHRPEGIMVVAGPGIRSGYKTEAQIVDMAPTVLHMLGLPVPSTMDGSVLEALFAPGSSLQRRDVQILESHIDTDQGSDLTREELAEIEKQLKDLGYLN